MWAAARHLAILIAVVNATSAFAHEGPPYPLVVDHATDFGMVSVWADPDVGNGTFTVLLEAGSASQRPDQIRLTASSAALNQPEIEYTATRAPELDNRGERMAYVGQIPFVDQGLWQVQVSLVNAATTARLNLPVEVTPPGPERWQLVLFLLPFLALAGLWLKAIYLRRGRA